ncbi:ABC transporter permease [Micromonospora sp. NPDC050417]|uniref:ABC transporter permease n=1 Tax=Micromonospora sp. NPDC050417 TaxID=3364280 RepID=UPI0037ADE930
MSRVLAATRVQLISWPAMVSWPWGILASSFLINLAVFALIADEMPDDPRTGGLVSIYVVVMIGAAQTITQFFPFSLGLSLTRRTFYAATSLLLVAESLVFGVLLYLCSLAERATDGWGLSLGFFVMPFMQNDNPLAQILIFTVPFIVLGYIGMFAALVLKRWGVGGLYLLSIVLLLLLGLLAVLVTWQHWWPAVGRWFADQSALALFAGWPALLALLLAGAGQLLMRRTTA